MKPCAYCGRDNDDQAITCRECGRELAPPPADSPAPRPRPWARAAVLDNEVQAQRLEVELTNRKIPHVLVSYADSAFDGLYQAGRGWGHVEAPAEHTEAIRALLAELQAGSG